MTPLPVDAVLPALCADLARGGNAVLCAPPGAGKTTRVPLALLHAPWLEDRRILMLEPRRLAAKTAARHMARLLGESPGQRVGYRMRLESRLSAQTRILVVTEGILTRMLQDDPTLEGIACVIFDEFHERSLHADTGLAFCLDVQAALRPDLRLLAMSATLDVQAVAHCMGACPVHQSSGKLWPVDIQYAPPPPNTFLEKHTAAVVRHALERFNFENVETLYGDFQENPRREMVARRTCFADKQPFQSETALADQAKQGPGGSVLVFLPGAAEIRRVESLLAASLPPDVMVYPLYGDLPPHAQDAAIAPCPSPQRKVLLATAIAETSLTIEGIRVVVDAGLARTMAYDPATGMGQLTTGRVSQASADQRAGRAGRTQEGLAFRLWAQGEALRPFARPEILEADLAPLLLQCLLWGVQDATALPWLDPPPAAALAEATQTLHLLGAVDHRQRLTSHGKELSRLSLHPRLAHMVLEGAQKALTPLAACLAALLEQRLPPRQSRDMEAHLAELCASRSTAQLGRRTQEHALQIARQLCSAAAPRTSAEEGNFFAQALAASAHCGSLLAMAWPERVAQRTAPGQYRLRNGRMVVLPEADPLAKQEYLAIASAEGQAASARIHTAAPLREEDLLALFGDAVEEKDEVNWDSRSEAVLARRQRMLGALVLHDAPLPAPAPDLVEKALLSGLRQLGMDILPWTDALRQWQARVACMHALEGDIWPCLQDAALLASMEHWLSPFLVGVTRRAHLKKVDLEAALHSLLSWDLQRRLDKELPTHLEVPSGSRLPVDYTASGGPVLSVKLQEMFGCAASPALAGGRLSLTLHLNSPAGRPLQVTSDLASFWKNGYASVRAEMRGRYPKHPWPEDPATAIPTRYTKARALRG